MGWKMYHSDPVHPDQYALYCFPLLMTTLWSKKGATLGKCWGGLVKALTASCKKSLWKPCSKRRRRGMISGNGQELKIKIVNCKNLFIQLSNGNISWRLGPVEQPMSLKEHCPDDRAEALGNIDLAWRFCLIWSVYFIAMDIHASTLLKQVGKVWT